MSFFRSSRLQDLSVSSQPQSKIIIDQKFVVKKLLQKHPSYSIYEGINLNALKLVTIYIKPVNAEYNFSKKIKEQLRNKLSPPLIWSGVYKMQKSIFNVEVHEKYGPSLKSMFNYLKRPISEGDFLLLMYQLIRLVEKYGAVGYIYRQLDMNHIVFDSKPQKNDVYLLNIFPLKKKGDESRVLNTRFCSRAAHLGLKSSIKDDLQSICYILLNIHMQGKFLKNISNEEYNQAKTNIDLKSFKRPLPPLFIDFYSYVLNLNYNDEINYFKWRNIIYKAIGKDAITNPYQWMLAKSKQDSQDKQQLNEGELDQLEDEIGPKDKHFLYTLQKKLVINNLMK